MPSPFTLIANSTSVLRADGAVIPADPANADFQAFQVFLAAGGVPLPAPVPPKPTAISAGAFLQRFPMAEQVAIQTAAAASPAIALGLTMGLASGSIDLTSATTISWMQGLV